LKEEFQNKTLSEKKPKPAKGGNLRKWLIDTSDNTLLEVVNSYENEFNKKTTDTVVKNNINFILFSMKQGIINSSLLYDNNRSFGYQAKSGGFWDCMGKTAGKAIGRGMVTGMIGGCITGAKIGATGGTVALPGIGTITGGVGGCILVELLLQLEAPLLVEYGQL